MKDERPQALEPGQFFQPSLRYRRAAKVERLQIREPGQLFQSRARYTSVSPSVVF